jgi:hypothetical protein
MITQRPAEHVQRCDTGGGRVGHPEAHHKVTNKRFLPRRPHRGRVSRLVKQRHLGRFLPQWLADVCGSAEADRVRNALFWRGCGVAQ